MTQKKLLLVIILWTLIFITGYVGFVKSRIQPRPNVVNESIIGQKFPIKRLQVLKGDFFDITVFEKDQRILAKLSVLATDDSKQKVLDLLHHSTNVSVLVQSKGKDGQWIVDIFLSNEEGLELSLTEWLEKNNLVYKSY